MANVGSAIHAFSQRKFLFLIVSLTVSALLGYWILSVSTLTRADTFNRCDYNRNGKLDENDFKLFSSFYGKYKDVDTNLKIDLKDFDLYCRQNKNP